MNYCPHCGHQLIPTSAPVPNPVWEPKWSTPCEACKSTGLCMCVRSKHTTGQAYGYDPVYDRPDYNK